VPEKFRLDPPIHKTLKHIFQSCPAPAPAGISPFALLAFLLISVNTISNIINSINNNNNNNNNNRDNNNNNNNLQAMNMNARSIYFEDGKAFRKKAGHPFPPKHFAAQSSEKAEEAFRRLLTSGADPWDASIFRQLRTLDGTSQKRPALQEWIL
jgi:hypothetical protein